MSPGLKKTSKIPDKVDWFDIMFIDLTSTSPTLDYRRCPKQLIIRVANSHDIEGIVFNERINSFRPAIEHKWLDRVTSRTLYLREYIVQPRLWPTGDGPDFHFTGLSTAVGVRNITVGVRLTLNYDGKSWDLGVIQGDPLKDGTLCWVPIPDYSPLCDDLTPLQEELEAAKEPEPPKRKKTAWEHITEDDD